jgi:hypothetical protein
MSRQLLAEADTNTPQQTRETNIHNLSEIRTRDPSNQAAAYLRVRPHGHRRYRLQQTAVTSIQPLPVKKSLQPYPNIC